MCGIAGIIFVDEIRKQEEIQRIRKITKSLLLELEKRGSDSSGMAVINKNCVRVFKQPVEAGKFVRTSLFNNMLDRITNNTKGIILHTRAATQGSKENIRNNHPIIAGGIIGVHNGIIYNDYEIFRNFRQHFTRKAEVDSEAMFRLINHYLKKDSIKDIKSIKKALRKLHGSMAAAFINRFDNGSFYLYSNDSLTPITLAYMPELRIFVFASKKSYIRHSTKRRRRKKSRCLYYDVKENELLKITTNTTEVKRYRAKTRQPDYSGYKYRTMGNSETLDYLLHLYHTGCITRHELELLNGNDEFGKSGDASSGRRERQLNLSGMFC